METKLNRLLKAGNVRITLSTVPKIKYSVTLNPQNKEHAITKESKSLKRAVDLIRANKGEKE